MSLFVLTVISILITEATTFRICPSSHGRVFTTCQVTSTSLMMKRKFPSTPLKFKLAEESETTLEEVQTVQFVTTDQGTSGKKSSLLKKLSNGVVPIAASLGFAVTPSSTIVTRIAGAAAGGAAGFLAKRAFLDKLFEDNSGSGGGGDGSGSGGSKYLSTQVVAALDQLVLDEALTSVDLQSLEKLAKKFSIPEDELKLFFTYVFADAVVTATQSNESDLLDLGSVIDFSENIGFSDNEIGDGFALACTKVGRLLQKDRAGFYEAYYQPEILLQAAKIYFLADKMTRSNRGYYGNRIDTALSFFTPEMYKTIITSSCQEMFQTFVNNVLLAPENFSQEEMKLYESFLSVSPHVSDFRPANMQNLIREAVQYTLDNKLKTNTIATPADVNFDNLARAKAIFGWNSYEFEATVEAKTLPVFEVSAKELLHECIEEPERAPLLAEKLNNMMKSLNIDIRKARAYMMTLISEQNAEYMNKIEKVYEVSGNQVEPAFKIMSSYAQLWEGFQILTAPVMEDSTLPIPGLPFGDMVRVNLYQLLLNKEKEGKETGVTTEMFVLNEDQQNIVKKYMALPKIISWITQCINENNFDNNAKNAYQKLLTEYKVNEKEWGSTSIDFYYQELQKVARQRAVPTEADMQRLTELSNFLNCPPELISKANMDLLGEKYVKAVSEAMTPTGVIVEEYRDGLDRLRNRLRLTITDAQTLLGVSARNRLIPVVKDLVDIYRSDGDANKRQQQARKDKSGDPIASQDNVLGYMESISGQKEGGGPNVFMREALNLVNFFNENYLNEGVDISTLEKLPISAVGVVPEEELLNTYKHYVITRLSESDPELFDRYQEDERVFALILGITPTSQQKVKESLAYTVYKNMLKNILRYKPEIETDDIRQFAVFKDRLGLDSQTGERILSEATKGAVLEHAATIIRQDEVPITSENARMFRQQVQSLGLDMRKDTGFNDKLVTYLYALEVQYIIDNDMENELIDAQEAYDIPADRAAEIVEACSSKYISQILNLALRDARKYNEDGCISWTNQIVKYMKFVSTPVDADGNKFTEDDKERLISFYDGYLKSTDRMNEIHDINTKLKMIIHLSDKYIPPLQGIDGLIGKVSGMQSLGGDPSDNRKKWAWGG